MLILALFLLTKSILVRVLWLVSGFLMVALSLYQINPSLILYVLLILYVSGSLILNLWLATYLKRRTSTSLFPLLGLPLLFMVESKNLSTSSMEPLSYLMENSLELGVIFLFLLLILLLLSSVLSSP